MQAMTSESCPASERSHWLNPRQAACDMSEAAIVPFALPGPVAQWLKCMPRMQDLKRCLGVNHVG